MAVHELAYRAANHNPPRHLREAVSMGLGDLAGVSTVRDAHDIVYNEVDTHFPATWRLRKDCASSDSHYGPTPETRHKDLLTVAVLALDVPDSQSMMTRHKYGVIAVGLARNVHSTSVLQGHTTRLFDSNESNDIQKQNDEFENGPQRPVDRARKNLRKVIEGCDAAAPPNEELVTETLQNVWRDYQFIRWGDAREELREQAQAPWEVYR